MISVFVTLKKLVSLKKRIVLHLILLPLISTSLALKTDSEKRHILPIVNDNIFNFIRLFVLLWYSFKQSDTIHR